MPHWQPDLETLADADPIVFERIPPIYLCEGNAVVLGDAGERIPRSNHMDEWVLAFGSLQREGANQDCRQDIDRARHGIRVGDREG